MAMIATSTASATPKREKELYGRELARRNLVDFSTYVAYPRWTSTAHHRAASRLLEQVETYIRTGGKEGIGRLLIMMPPRHGKTLQCSQHFPAWLLGKQPDSKIILTSYGEGLATGNSRAVRDMINSDRYRAVFGSMSCVDTPVELSTDSRSVASWDLAAPNRGGLIAASVGSGITGFGAHLLVVDDPFKDRVDVESQSSRDRVWGWWTSTAYTRLESGGAVVGSLTHWNGDDWAGRLIKAMVNNPEADQWHILCLQAIYEPCNYDRDKETFEDFKLRMMREGIFVQLEDPLGRRPGTALWPNKYPAKKLMQYKINVGPYDWESLYQQRPYSREGNLFKRDWFTVVETPPKPEDIIARVRYWDKAGSKSGKGDYSVGVLMCLTRDDVYYVEHVARIMGTPGDRDHLMQDTGKIDMQRAGIKPVIWHEQDPGSAGLDSAQATNRMFAKLGITAYFEQVSGSKPSRAGPWSTQCQAGNVRLVRGAWNDPYIEVHLRFGSTKSLTDDDVDASSGAYSKLSRPRLKEPSSWQG